MPLRRTYRENMRDREGGKIAFKYKDIEMFRKMYTTYIPTKQEEAATSWSPHLKSNTELLEKFQRNARRMVLKLSRISY